MRRRDLLQRMAGASLVLPFLECLAPRRAWAGETPPERVIFVHHRQGTVLSSWASVGSERDFVLGPILAPLERHRDRLLVIGGIDNPIITHNPPVDAHQGAETSILTGQVLLDPGDQRLGPAGPSIDAVLAGRLAGPSPYRRLDFAVGGSFEGTITSNEFWHGARDPVVFTNDPARQLAALFGDVGLDDDAFAALQARRGSVLDTVHRSFDVLRPRLGVSDRRRLDAHLDKVRALELRVAAERPSCVVPTVSLPDDYDMYVDDHVTAPPMIDMLVRSLACDLTRVGTLFFANSEHPTFHWLDVDGEPVVPLGRYASWHQMVHLGRDEPGLVTGFTWYAEMVAALLDQLAETLDVDGVPLLDRTLVVWSSDFGNGINHGTRKIPYVLAGNLAGVETGRWLDHMAGGPDDIESDSGYSIQQMYTSVLQMFDQPDTRFGFDHPEVPNGPLPFL